MTLLTLPAAKVQQGDLTLFSTAIKVEILIQDNFYSVETLDPSDTGDSGYQRLLNQARARKLADYIVGGQDSRDAFLPTSVFLATAEKLDFDTSTNTVTFDPSAIGPFSVVDGQHRLEGLKIAAEKDKRVLDFVVPVNIAASLPKLHQMCHFLIVNTTQKSVDEAVGQQIVARLTEALKFEDVPSLPKWILKVVERGEVDKALKLVKFLNEEPGSPWRGKIKMANDPASSMINQASFVKAINKHILTANNPISVLNDFDTEKRIFLNYWKAIVDIIHGENIDDENTSVLYKYNGVQLFCQFSISLFIKLQESGNYKVDTIKSLLRDCFENVEGDYAGVGHSQWWTRGGTASGLNTAAIRRVAHEMTKALHKSSMSTNIEL